VATFKSDAQGFLVGELLETNRNLLRTAERERATWRSIAADVTAIARALGVGRGRSAPAPGQRARGVAVSPAGRGSGGRAAAAGQALSPDAARRQVAAVARAAVAAAGGPTTVTPKARDARGRFAARPGAAAPDAPAVEPAGASALARAADGRFSKGAGPNRSGVEAGDESSASARAQGIAKSVVSGLMAAAGGNGVSVDPTLQAASEIKDVIAPLGRGVFSAMGERRKEAKRQRWYDRILKALTRKRQDVQPPMVGGDGSDSVGFLGALSGLGRFLPALVAMILPALAGLAGTWLGGRIYDWLDKSGILTKVFDAFDAVRDFIEGAKKKATTWLGEAASGFSAGFSLSEPVDASGRQINDPRRVDAKPKSATQRVSEVLGKGVRVASDLVAKPAETIAGAARAAVSGVRRVVSAGKGFTEVEEGDGTLSRRTGARNWRNNNPGNLEFNAYTKSLGAVGSDGRFAVFPTLQEGRTAQGKMLFEGKSYRGLDLKAAIARYAPPSENDTARYQQAVLDSVGGANKHMGDYTPVEREAILSAMARVEGFKPGTVTPVAGQAVANVPAVAAANMPALSVPRAPSLPPVPDTWASVRLSSDAPPPAPVVVVQEPVGQNVRDRNIAHAVTGGLGG